ncbi:gamma-glutamyltransferase [Wenzhouxiangella sp. XN201]|uniref:gamma-glutamyltransferase n=1 Tax=Wenzhouxiangella sp. XN201 TaxID=2710755 RepID=UPI0013C9A045|nr:gamma-glutamyltransferase [Wenzhouxiangella sp. XN201]NEZ05137.1 gamma-glutamyltransferase [Wenzhouxiangella sp. XN201]
MIRTVNAILIGLLATLAVAAIAEQGPERAAISSSHELATEAGAEILDKGGNAFDAAVAVSAALAVVEPESSGAGGGGFWLLHRASEDVSVMVDGRETAPAAATEDMYLDEAGEVDRDRAVNGALAGGIPGAPAAWVHIAEKYGTLPLSELLAPAIRLAENGFPVDAKYQALINYRAHVMMRWPETAAIFLPGGEVPEIGATIRNPDLAVTLRALAEQGRDGFYSGEVARKLVEGVQAAGGIWTLADFAGYEVAEREPIRTDYRGYELITASPPSSGGIAIAQMLEIVEPFDLAGMSSADRVHLLAEAMRRAYRDRALYLGDPDFVDIPTRMLLSEDYAAGLRTTLRLDRATPSSMLAADPSRLGTESTDTTHFSLMDDQGNIVSATLTVNLPFGAAFAPPGTGVLVNNEMDDFSAKPGEPNAYGLIGFSANAIEPGKRMLSSMSPTIVRGENRTAVIGTPGGSRIITMVLLGILDFIDGNGPESWVSLPRFHHQYLPDEISIERGALDDATIAALEEKGHEVTVRDRTWGNMHGVMWHHDSGELEAAHDPRWASGGAVVVELD